MKESAGLILIDRKLSDEPTVLCLRAYSNWDFPKGEIESGETKWQTALRELEEETGYKMSDISLMSFGVQAMPWMSCTYGKGKNKKTAYYSIVERVNAEKAPTLPINPALGKPEHDEWRWVKVSELTDILPDRLKQIGAAVAHIATTVI